MCFNKSLQLFLIPLEKCNKKKRKKEEEVAQDFCTMLYLNRLKLLCATVEKPFISAHPCFQIQPQVVTRGTAAFTAFYIEMHINEQFYAT